MDVAHGFDAEWVASDQHLAFCGQQCHRVGTVETGSDLFQHVDPVDSFLRLRKQTSDLVENDLRVGVECQVVVAIGEQPLLQKRVVGQLAIEAEAEPFAFVDVPSLEWLSVVSVIGTTGGVANVSDRGAAGQRFHQ